MNNQTMKTLRTALYTAAIAAMLGLPANAAQTTLATRQAQAMALAAEAASGQAEATKQQRVPAAEALVREDQARKLARSTDAMAYKWPAMLNGLRQEIETAVQARR